MAGELYDRIGTSYRQTRRPDPRLAAAIHAALGDARTVLNVGAGAGAYEPPDREVTAVEPSETMIAQRPEGSAPVVRAYAEALPFPDKTFDAAMAVLSDHHWTDRTGGLLEMRRVARRTVVFSFDDSWFGRSWLMSEYFPDALPLVESFTFPEAEVTAIPIPHDCTDGFLHAYWRRPEAYLDPVVRDNISVFRALGPELTERGLARLKADLESGAWHERHADLLELTELDLGYRLHVWKDVSSLAA